ncbi:MAG: hypothetical protein ACLFQ6_01650 [Candidatus Sumerlaeia bacterium]
MNKEKPYRCEPLPQDLHIHTVYSTRDPAVAPQQTLDFIREVAHAEICGISDHFDCLSWDKTIEQYIDDVKAHGFHAGIELLNSSWVEEALDYPFEYFIFHTDDEPNEYRALEWLLETGKPVIVPHPGMMGTDLGKVPPDCLIEVSNRYAWKADWRAMFKPHLDRFRFVISSDAHYPSMLNQRIARHIARELNITETLLFDS